MKDFKFNSKIIFYYHNLNALSENSNWVENIASITAEKINIYYQNKRKNAVVIENKYEKLLDSKININYFTNIWIFFNA